MANWLHDAADIVAIATALVSWRGFVGLALAVIAWLAIDWRKLYGVFHLGTQMNRLQYEQFILVNEVLPDNYLRLAPATRARAEDAIRSLNADVFDCQSRYLALPTLGYIQYAVEVFSLYIAVRAILRRLHEIQREVEA